MRAVLPLIEALKDSEWKVRRAAAEALGYFTSAGSKSIQPLIDRLQDDKAAVRQVAMLSLGRMGKGSSEVEAAVRQLAEDSDPITKMNAQIALALMGKSDGSAIPELMSGLGSKEDTTAKAAGLALSRLGQQSHEKLLPGLDVALNSNEEPLAANALKVLKGMKSGSAQFLPHLARLYDKVDSKKRRLVLQTVVEMDAKGDQALPLCASGLADPDPLTRKEALMGALRYRSRLDTFLEPLIEAIKDQNEENRLLAIGIIRGFGNRAAKAIPSLISLAQKGTPRVRVSALSCLAIFTPPSEEVIRILESGLVSSDEKVKMAALGSLRTAGQSNPDSVIPILEKALEAEKQEKTKRSIIAALDGLKKTRQGTGSR
jgi:HEAT repeat protein